MDPLSIPAALREAVRRFGDAEALVVDDVRLTWAELAEHVRDATRAYMAAGVCPGDRIRLAGVAFVVARAPLTADDVLTHCGQAGEL